MASSDHADAPKAIRVVSILGIIGAALSIIMVFVGIGVLEELPPILLFILLLTIVMIVLCVQNGFTLDWVPIRTIYAGEGSHISPLKHAAEFVRVSIQTRRSLRQGRHPRNPA